MRPVRRGALRLMEARRECTLVDLLALNQALDSGAET